MPFFVDPGEEYEAVPVGVVEQTVLAATNIRGEDHFLIVLTNPSLTETFYGTCASSPNGVTQWTSELNDEFAEMAPGATRRMLLPADRLFARVTGRFGTAPDTIRLTTTKLRQATRRG